MAAMSRAGGVCLACPQRRLRHTEGKGHGEKDQNGNSEAGNTPPSRRHMSTPWGHRFVRATIGRQYNATIPVDVLALDNQLGFALEI